MQYIFNWTDRRSGKNVYKYIWFKSDREALEYVKWCRKETGRHISVKSLDGLYLDETQRLHG